MSQKKATALLTKSIQLMKSNHYDLAINQLERLLKNFPNDITARMNLGVCKFSLHKYHEAAIIFHKLHEIQPDNVTISKSAGISYMHLGNYDLALKFLSRALKSTPKDIDLLSSMANLLIHMNRETDAIYFATQAISIDPTNSGSYNNLGSCLFNLNRYKDAITCYQTSLDLDPGNFIALSNYANSLDKIGEHSKSIELYEQCLSNEKLTDQQLYEIRYKMSLPLLSVGRLVEGWENFEYGLLYKDRQSRKPQRQFVVPRWTGDVIINKTLLVWREQGLGDELIYLSLLPQVFDFCQDIIVECDSRLISLLKRSFPTCRFREQSYNPATLEQSESTDFDYHLPMGSLPLFFLKSKEDFHKNKPYLISDKNRVLEFKKKIKNITKKPVIGISWRSGVNNSARNANYTSISDWKPILEIENITFVNLQYGECQNELEGVRQEFGVHIINFEDLDLKNDLEGVCALMSALDGVVSAGTAVASLAAANGVPLMLYKNPGWDDLGTDIYPWSPEVNLYITQQPGNFTPLIMNIASDLKKKFP